MVYLTKAKYIAHLKYKFTLILTALTPFLIVIAVFLSGGGHGYFEPLIFLFPFSAVSMLFFNEINLFFAMLSLVQYPVYGFIIERSKTRKRKGAVLLIASIHISIAVVVYILSPEHFS